MRMQHKFSGQEVLYLSYDGMTDPLGQSQILPYLVGLADEGYSITIISFEKPHRLKENRTHIELICKSRSLHWTPLKYHKFPPVLSTVYDMLLLRWAVNKVLSKKDVTIIHCRSYLTSLTGLWAKQKLGVKFIFDMRGFWADERVDGGLWNLKNPIFRFIYSFFKKMEKQFIRNADHIVSLTENGKSQIESWQVPKGPISVIPTCVDMDLFDPEKTVIDAQSLRRTLSISDADFVLVYVGSWGTWYMTEEILAFFTTVLFRQPEARLIVLTPDLPDLTHYPFASKVIVKHVTRSEVPSYLALADASVCFIKPAFSKKGSSATKMAEAFAMNLPVVTNSGWGDIERLGNSGLPLYICKSQNDYPRIAQLIINRVLKNGREMLYGEFDLRSGIEKYKRIYQSLRLL